MSGRRRRPCPRTVSTDPVPRSFPDSLRRFLSLSPGNPEGTGARIGSDGDLQLRLPVEGVILRDDANLGAAPPEALFDDEKPGLGSRCVPLYHLCLNLELRHFGSES